MYNEQDIMEWKEKYPKSQKPAYADLLSYFQSDIKELFLKFDETMQAEFQVYNKYHKFLKDSGWVYGYGRGFNCVLLTVTIQKSSFLVLGISVKDDTSLKLAIAKAKEKYEEGYEKNYAEVRRKRLEKQKEYSKVPVTRQILENCKTPEGINLEKLNQFNWSRKVSRSDLYRLYQGEARGMLNEDLLEDIGLIFYLRCKQAKEVRECLLKGQMICLNCGKILQGGKVTKTGSLLTKDPANYTPIYCECGNIYTYREYRRNCNSNNVPGGRATPIFEEYLQRWTSCKDTRDKMFLIDWLIHQCHVTLMSGDKGRSVGVNLIEGTLAQVTELILKLAY